MFISNQWADEPVDKSVEDTLDYADDAADYDGCTGLCLLKLEYLASLVRENEEKVGGAGGEGRQVILYIFAERSSGSLAGSPRKELFWKGDFSTIFSSNLS